MIDLDIWMNNVARIREHVHLETILQYDVTNESHGNYPDQIRLASKIAKDVIKCKDGTITYNVDDLNDYKNVMFKTMNVVCGEIGDFVDININSFDKDTGMFPDCNMYIMSWQSYKEIVKSISHELLHIYQNAKVMISGKNPNERQSKFNQENLLNCINDRGYNPRASFEENKYYFVNSAKRLCYALLDFEKEAYTSEIDAMFTELSDDERNKLCSNSSKASSMLLKNPAYRLYINRAQIIEDMLKLNKDDIEDSPIACTYCSIARETWTNKAKWSNRKVLNFLKNELDKAIRKMEKYFAMSYYEHIYSKHPKYFESLTHSPEHANLIEIYNEIYYNE